MTEALTNSNPNDQNTHDEATSAAGVAHAQKPTRSAVIADGFKNRTKGEQLFNRMTYLGVGYFGVTGVSVFLTWLLRDSKAMSPHFEKFTEKLVNGLRERKFTWLADKIYSNMTIATLFLGGSLASVLPVKWLEDNKAKIVQRFDRGIYGKEVVENDPDIRQAHADMEAMPKQTWGSVTASRVLAFGTTFATSFLMGSEGTPVSKLTGGSIDSVSTNIGRSVDSALHKGNLVAQHDIEQARAANKQWFKESKVLREDKKDGIAVGNGADRVASRIFSYISLDGFYTIITSASLYVFTRVLAPVLGKKQKAAHHEPQAGDVAPAAPAQVIAHTPVDEGKNAASPRLHISQPSHHQRIAEPAVQEITA